MILFLLVFILAIALTIWFAFISDASLPAKIPVAVLSFVSWWLRYSRYSLAGFSLQIGLSIGLAVYQQIKSQ